MAFNYDRLACGFSPDYCSTCTANDCHGACACDPRLPGPGLLCEGCSGTGCPMCMCEPAPQQTFLSHSRVSFPKCTCDRCPKRCDRCCRKRIACDCLPSDICRYDERTGEMVWFDEEEENMNIDYPVSYMDTESNFEGNTNNFNNSEEPMEVEYKHKRKSKSILKRKSSKKRRSLKNYRRRRSGKTRRSRRQTPQRKQSRSCCTSCKDGGDCESREQSEEQYNDQYPSVYNNNEEYSSANERLLSNQEELSSTNQIQPEWVDDYDPMNAVLLEENRIPCKIVKKKGPCRPPQMKFTPHDRDAIDPERCNDCERPCYDNEMEDPCNPRPICVCKEECNKEYCMEVDGKCTRCAPRERDVEKQSCVSCPEPPKLVKLKRKKKKGRCDSEECEDSCEILFGKCLPPQPCYGPCSSGECENACAIM